MRRKLRVKFLSSEQILVMHEVGLERWGGKTGGGHRGASYEGAEAVVYAVMNSYYDTLEELAAAYAVYIVQGHVFMDGNKRAALYAMATFLRLNRVRKLFPRARFFALMVDLQRWSEQGASTKELVSFIAGQIAMRGHVIRVHRPRGRR